MKGKSILFALLLVVMSMSSLMPEAEARRMEKLAALAMVLRGLSGGGGGPKFIPLHVGLVCALLISFMIIYYWKAISLKNEMEFFNQYRGGKKKKKPKTKIKYVFVNQPHHEMMHHGIMHHGGHMMGDDMMLPMMSMKHEIFHHGGGGGGGMMGHGGGGMMGHGGGGMMGHGGGGMMDHHHAHESFMHEILEDHKGHDSLGMIDQKAYESVVKEVMEPKGHGSFDFSHGGGWW